MFFACLFSCSVSISLLFPPSAFITFFLLFKFPAIFSGHCARGGGEGMKQKLFVNGNFPSWLSS
jgi:hypothetical protein